MSSTRLPLSARPSFLPDEISRREFATVFRGYDPAEVRTFLNQLAEQAADSSDLIAEIQRSLAHTEEQIQNPELDEETVTRLLGEQTAQILRSAREAANEMRLKAEEQVSRQLREAHEVSSRMKNEAEALLADRTDEAERMAEAVRIEASTEAEQLRNEANEEALAVRTEVAQEVDRQRRELAEELSRLRANTEAELLHMRQQTQADLVDERAKARQQARDLIDTARAEAQALVDRTQARQEELIEGLLRKRKIALAQVEELRVGRQRLLKAYKMVRGTLDEVTTELERVEAEARQEAELAGTKSAQSSGLQAEEIDSVIELEEFSVNDDVSGEIINLVEQEEITASISAIANTNSGTESSGNVPGSGVYDITLDDDLEIADISQAEVVDVEVIDDADEDASQSETTVQELWPLANTEENADESGDAFPEDSASTSSESRRSAADPVPLGKNTQRPSSSSGLIIGESFSLAGNDPMDRALKLRRDAVVGKARSQAVRRLKRALQDEQDALVARIRVDGVKPVEELLGSAEDQSSSYHRAVVKLFREVVRTGASSVEGSTGVERGVIDRTGTAAARGLATELVEELRGQLQPVLDELLALNELPEAGELQHQLATAYRAIKGEYLEQMVDDRIGGVFDQGVTFARP